ncbi:MAG: xanthine dehydrogenase family protein subunit M [Pseudomonadota bacterium]
MFPAEISHYARPSTIEEALAEIKAFPDGDGVFIAGGQSLMQAIKSRIVRPEAVIDLQDVQDLKGITVDENVSVKPMTRYVEIAECEGLPNSVLALCDAASHVGDRQVRNRGTIGGSLCWNYIASCMPAVALSLDAALTLGSASGNTRDVSADDFFLGPLETAREDDEILVDVSFESPANTGSAYKKWGLVTDALPVVGIAARLIRDGEKCSGARIAFSGLANGAERCPDAESKLEGHPINETAFIDALDAAVNAMETQSDQWASSEYRQQLIRSIGKQVLELAWQRAA